MKESVETNRTKVLAILPAFIPSTHIDVITPLLDLHKVGLIEARISLEINVSIKDVKWCDVAVLCRNTEPLAAKWFWPLLEFDKPYIYDIDDNLLELKGDSPLVEYHNEPSQQKMLTEYIRLASLVRVYSAPMYDRVKELNENVIKVVAPVDFRLISPKERSPKTDIVKIVYATSRPDDYLADIFIPALKRIVQEYEDRVKIYFLGYSPPEFKETPNVVRESLVFNYEQYLRGFSRAGYDIGLAPLYNDIFHRSKTNNKFREYGACRIAGIYSDVDVYASCVVNNKTGLLVDNDPEAWYQGIASLIENHELRLSIQKDAYKFVQQNYSQSAFADLWYKQIVQMKHSRREKDYREIYQLTYYQGKKYWFLYNHWKWLSKRVENNIRDIGKFGISFVMAKVANYIRTQWTFFRIQLRLVGNRFRLFKD